MASVQRTEADASDSPHHEADAESPTANASFTFVPHDPSQPSQSSMTDVQQDRFAHTRTKRKRTSATDFAVLEREYERDPRPDKTARADISSRVSLSEKEVQIWFQNRRQMTRRKARTWQPNEISEIIRSSQQTRGSASPPASQQPSSQSQLSDSSALSEKTNSEAYDKPASGLFENTSMESFGGETRPIKRVDGAETGDGLSIQGEFEEAVQTLNNDAENPVSIMYAEASVSEEVDTQNLSIEGTDSHEQPTESPVEPQRSDRSLRRTRSNVRLRMSMEGKAELVLDGNTPSPPSKSSRRESWPARAPLGRSESAVGPSDSLGLSRDLGSSTPPCSTGPWSQARAVGRSRDARTWEFYCDPDTRDALSIAAEHDSRGSAEGALGLLRSNSGTTNKKATNSPLMPSLRKQNSHVGRRDSSRTAEKSKTAEKRKSLEDLASAKPKLARTASSVARLQTSHHKPYKPSGLAALSSSQPLATKSKDGALEIWEDPETDSDKENWQPGTRTSAPAHPRQESLTATARVALGTNLTELSHESSLGALMENRDVANARRTRNAPQTGRHGNKAQMITGPVDEDVAAFMGEQRSDEVTSGEELDAVQNLLSLSQGLRR